jgi:hypothetical protein
MCQGDEVEREGGEYYTAVQFAKMGPLQLQQGEEGVWAVALDPSAGVVFHQRSIILSAFLESILGGNVFWFDRGASWFCGSSLGREGVSLVRTVRCVDGEEK